MEKIPWEFVQIEWRPDGSKALIFDRRKAPPKSYRTGMSSTGACYSWWGNLFRAEYHAEILSTFIALTTRHGYKPEYVMQAFECIEGWPEMISDRDAPGGLP